MLKKKTVDLLDAPDEPARLELDFEKGAPVALREHDASGDVTATTGDDPLELFAKLNQLAGAHGVGRIDIVENRYVGMKSRGCYETPAGTVLAAAHLDLETLTVDREVMRLRDGLSIKFAELVYNGYWFSPEMDFLRAAMGQAQTPVSGTVSDPGGTAGRGDAAASDGSEGFVACPSDGSAWSRPPSSLPLADCFVRQLAAPADWLHTGRAPPPQGPRDPARPDFAALALQHEDGVDGRGGRLRPPELHGLHPDARDAPQGRQEARLGALGGSSVLAGSV